MSLHSDSAAADVATHLQQQIETAIASSAEDVGAALAPSIIAAWAELRHLDAGAFARLRKQAKKANADLSLAELDRAIQRADAEDDGGGSTLDTLVALARSRCELFHDADRQAIAVIPMDDHRQVWRVQSSGFADWLRSLWWTERRAGLQDTLLKAALATLAAAGIHEGESVQVHLRAARTDDGYYLDLGDPLWRVVHIGDAGWQLLETSPVLFIRTPAMRALPVPNPHLWDGRDLDRLWDHINVRTEDRLLVLAWLLDCLRPETPFPALELVGEQGSAKSTTQSVLRDLVDPNKVPLRGRPKTVEDIFVAAANNWLVSYENLSSLTAEQQDALCTLATGGGFAARQLFTNGEEHVLQTKRPVILNGISVIATRPDLIDRVVHLNVPPIPASRRKDDAVARTAWESDRAAVFTGLLDLFALVFQMVPAVALPIKQRMADFERLGEAVALALRQPQGTFQARYADLVRSGIDRALDDNPVASALDKFLHRETLPWIGTAGTLHKLLGPLCDSDRSLWPRSPKGFSNELRRIAAAYRMKGIDLESRGHTRRGAEWRITRLPGGQAEHEYPVWAPADTTREELDAAEAAARRPSRTRKGTSP
ncbi:hypothetical protein [Lysobacter enzymogenes]|uniref:hypothetical protein n=1 Tax=Lysobacter enzymogenes TaxID=69 RepID=UPI001AF6FCDE|nr:hypothetical protein [Lysobacter enzymogenes]QQQ01275.1 hypothetical protein JHW41_25090 [Lysobacter enzymogenes]